MLLVSGINLTLSQKEDFLKDKVSKKLNINKDQIRELNIVKKSLDARKKDKINFLYSVSISLEDESKYIGIKDVRLYEPEKHIIETIETKKKVAVIGYGPAGMFAALNLASVGVEVHVFERGEDVDSRKASVSNFWNGGELNTESNVQYGEGGAGTFSDGKLYSRTKNKLNSRVFYEFIQAGAPSEIGYVYNPHIGTDLLVDVVKNIRNKTKELGGSVHFNSKVENININNDKVVSITVNNEELIFDDYILAIGHSARDTFEMLFNASVKLTPKPFAVGFRIEHHQEFMNKAQYGKNFNHPRLGAAEYRLTHQTKDKRGVYTFCMCPGGFVVPSQTEVDTVVVNGMSEYARDQKNANSAILVSVKPEDIKGNHPLKMMNFQRKIEERAFKLGGGDYKAPIQKADDFVKNKFTKKIGEIEPSYALGYKLANLRSVYPEFINNAIDEGLMNFDRKIKGFLTSDAILTGVETRSSSPIWILREKDTYNSVGIKNLFPCGEGAGYAGGITSSAIDGLKVSEYIISKYKN